MVVYCYGLISVYRFASLFVRPVCSREAILSLPRKPFTTVFSTVSKTWKRRRRCKTFLTGGIGESCFFFLCNYLIDACTYRKIFPQAHNIRKCLLKAVLVFASNRRGAHATSQGWGMWIK